MDRPVRHVGAPMADADRVAVGRGADDPSAAARAAGAGDVLDDDGLAQEGTDALGHDSPDRVSRTARRKRHDHHDGPRWIGLRLGDAGAARDRRKYGGGEYQFAHGPPFLIAAAI